MSWLPTLRAMWSPKGQQVMIPTPGQPHRRYGIGAVNYHTGETVVQFQRRKRRQEIALLLEALLAKHPTGTVYVAWGNASTHEDDEVEDVVRAAAGRLVLLYLPTYSPWLNPIEMLWRHFRREVTHGELFASVKALLAAAADFFTRHNREPRQTLSIIGSNAANLACLYLAIIEASAMAFQAINKKVGTRLIANNYTEVASGWIPRSLFDRAGVIAIDHYARTSDALYNDIKAIHDRIGLPVFLEEWGNYWDSTPLKPFLVVLGRLADEGILTGFNYWGAWPGAQEGLLNDDLTVNARGKEVAAFFASRQPRKTFTGIIPHTTTSVRRMKRGVLRVTLDIQDADVLDTSRILATIGKPVSITIERKD